MLKELRLFMWADCPKGCPECCNQYWDLDALPDCEDYSPYDVISITGGEPMIDTRTIQNVIRQIRKTSKAEIYVYTAKVDELEDMLPVVYAADGLTVTLHHPEDVTPFLRLVDAIAGIDRSLRANIFKGVHVPSCILPGWKVKRDKVYVANAPLPRSETLMRWDGRQS
jgi:hypothetical protein